ncbi:MAG: type II secretion system protein [Bdellovibrionota bacterium]
MKSSNTESLGEQGFTLIELLVTTSIIAILSALAIVSFIVYRENAEYSKGSAAMRNARTAMGAGELELPDGYTLPFTQTTSAGGLLSGELAHIMPGGITPSAVRLGAEYNQCDDSSGPFDRAAYLVLEPCLAKQEVRWQRFCGGTEVLLEHVSNPAPCS